MRTHRHAVVPFYYIAFYASPHFVCQFCADCICTSAPPIRFRPVLAPSVASFVSPLLLFPCVSCRFSSFFLCLLRLNSIQTSAPQSRPHIVHFSRMFARIRFLVVVPITNRRLFVYFLGIVCRFTIPNRAFRSHFCDRRIKVFCARHFRCRVSPSIPCRLYLHIGAADLFFVLCSVL